jgi:OOP family OmpA-OmpF porin
MPRYLKEKMMNRSRINSRKTLLSLALVLATSGAMAQDGNGWYGGLGVGKAWSDIDNNGIRSAVTASGSSVNSFSDEDDDTTWKVLGGYSFNQNWALEASWFDLGEFGFNAGLLPAAQLSGSTEATGYGLDLVATFLKVDRLSFLARVGINNIDLDQSASSTLGGRLPRGSDRDVNETLGLGLQYAVNDRFNLRTEFTRYGIDDSRIVEDSIDALTVGFTYKFGVKPAPVVVAEPEPEPAPAPAPAPLMEVTLGAEALFDFDKSELKPEGRARLDQLLTDINGLDYDSVIVIGHTDRIGTRDYNIALSNRRAEAVRAYLVQGGITAGSITARGMNSDEPVTTTEQCAGRRGDALIACYAPDRRVVVEVHGERVAE